MEAVMRNTAVRKFFLFLVLAAAFLAWTFELSAQSRIKEFVSIQYAQDREIIGYGLVTGLDRTGDRTIRRQGATFTVQSIANMLQNFGINVEPDYLRTRNVAAVMVTAQMSPFHTPGSKIDVTVSSLGDASSLVGGILLQTPLIDPNDPDFEVRAQGSLIVGGNSVEMTGARIRNNQTTTAIVPNGGNVLRNQLFQFNKSVPLGLIVKRPDYTNAQEISDRINDFAGEELAAVFNAGLVRIQWPDILETQGELNGFVSAILDLDIYVDIPARIVINERTGTIVAGGDVRIGTVMVSHGNIQVKTQAVPFVSQPSALTIGGQAISGNIPTVSMEETNSKTFVLEANTNVADLAAMLNSVGLSPRDIISIFQAIEKQGSLKAELVIM